MNHLFPSLRTAISTAIRQQHPRPTFPRKGHPCFLKLPPRYLATMTSGEPTVPLAGGIAQHAEAVAENPLPAPTLKYGKVVLAPMVRTGWLPTRLVSLKYGADLVWGPEVIDRAIIGCERIENTRIGTVDYMKEGRLVFRCCPAVEKPQLIFQIGTASPELAAEAAKTIARDVSGVDLNSGCPKHFSVHAGMGAGLLKNRPNQIAILKSLIEAVGPSTEYNLPVSVKIRLLNTVEATHDLITELCKTGIAKLTLHCRTTPMRPNERAIRDALAGAAKICKDAGVTFFVNGDIENYDHAQEVIKEYEIEGGAMIATSAELNPSVFTPKSEGGPKPWREVLREYILTAMRYENSFANTKICVLHLVPPKEPEFRTLSKCKTFKEICDIMELECTIPEEKDLGTPRTQKHKAIEEKIAQAKKEKEERLAKKAEAVKRKREEMDNDWEEKNKKSKVDGVEGNAATTTAEAVAQLAATTPVTTNGVGEAIRAGV